MTSNSNQHMLQILNKIFIQFTLLHEGCARWDVECNDAAGGIACCVCCHRFFLAVYMLLQLFAHFSQFIGIQQTLFAFWLHSCGNFQHFFFALFAKKAEF